MTASVPSIGTPEPPAAGADRANILIVDDRPDKLLVFKTILEELGQNIVTLQSGEEALRWLLDNECAVLLLDVNMPGMDGFETAEMVRARRKSAHTPIIFITSHVDEIHSLRGYALGAVDFLLAPVMPTVLRSMVCVFVQLFNLTRQIRQRADEHIALVREQAARNAAEEGSRRAHFLADAGKVFISSLDLRALMVGTTRLIVPFLADFSAMTIIHADNGVESEVSSDDWRATGIPTTDPDDGERCGGRVTDHPRWLTAVREVVATGRPLTLDDFPIAPAHLAGRFEAVDHARAGVAGLTLLPLTARGQTHGALGFANLPSRRSDDSDAALAADIASRAATAIDNCLLYRETQEIDTRKNEFLATLSHELRNPLAPIRTAIHALHVSGQWPAGAEPMRDMLERQLEHLTRLVDDLLDVSRITHGKIRLRRETVDLVSKVRYALDNCREPLGESGHVVQLRLPDHPVWISGDRVRVQQVFENLILNACRYTEPGGRIDVALSTEGEEAVFEIRDTGIGIPAEMMPRLFDMFAQGDSMAERHRHGLGIGLALVRNLVRLHGGSISAASEGAGKGSTFTVRLPLAAQQAAPQVSAPQTNRQMGLSMDELRILVVDDNTDAAESLKMLLSVFGHQVEIAHDGQSAIALARTQLPQVVFLDIGLPGMDGYEVARRFRSDADLADSKLIALSGYGTENDQQRSRAAGFNRHLVKPVDPSELPAIIAEVAAQP
jgi:signal transduction histidine kinase/DNA-binding response OmpR family regulator